MSMMSIGMTSQNVYDVIPMVKWDIPVAGSPDACLSTFVFEDFWQTVTDMKFTSHSKSVNFVLHI